MEHLRAFYIKKILSTCKRDCLLSRERRYCFRMLRENWPYDHANVLGLFSSKIARSRTPRLMNNLCADRNREHVCIYEIQVSNASKLSKMFTWSSACRSVTESRFWSLPQLYFFRDAWWNISHFEKKSSFRSTTNPGSFMQKTSIIDWLAYEIHERYGITDLTKDPTLFEIVCRH